MNVISNAADAKRFAIQVAADCRNVGVHAGPKVTVQPRCAIFGAKDNVNDDLAERLRHCGMIAERRAQENRAFSAGDSFSWVPGALPQAGMRSRRWRSQTRRDFLPFERIPPCSRRMTQNDALNLAVHDIAPMRQGRRFIQAWGNAPGKDSIKLISRDYPPVEGIVAFLKLNNAK
jgi:hypothetical protein